MLTFSIMTQSFFDEKRQTKDHTQDELYEGNAAGDVSQYAVVAEVEKRTTWFVWLLVACCTISGLLFGMGRVFHFEDGERLTVRCIFYRV
jgi:hypothetical protein